MSLLQAMEGKSESSSTVFLVAATDRGSSLFSSLYRRCVRGVSSRTTHLVTGEAGLVKGQAVISESTKKVQSRPGITKLDEQGFYAFIKEEAERLAKAETERLAKADQAEP